MRLEAGEGEISIREDDRTPGHFEVWIHNQGTGEEGGVDDLSWTARVTPDQLRAIGRAMIDFADGK